MERRQAATEATRLRILEATSALHRERGIAATTIQDVAKRADVAVGTVYRYFPTLQALVDACGSRALERLKLPDEQELARVFAAVASCESRLERLASQVARLYRDGAVVFERVGQARGFLPVVDDAYRRLEQTLDSLAAAALERCQPDADRRAAVRALIDVRVWRSLLEHGVEPDHCEVVLGRLLLGAIDSSGDSRTRKTVIRLPTS